MYQTPQPQNYAHNPNPDFIKSYFKTALTMTLSIFALATAIFSLTWFIFNINSSPMLMTQKNIASPDDTSGATYIAAIPLMHMIIFVFSTINAVLFFALYIKCNKEDSPAIKLKPIFNILAATPFLQLIAICYFCRSLFLDSAQFANDPYSAIFFVIFGSLIVGALFLVIIIASVYYIFQHTCFRSIAKSFDAPILNGNGVKTFSVFNMIIGVSAFSAVVRGFDFSNCTTTAQIFSSLSETLALICFGVQSILLSRLLSDYKNQIVILNNRYMSVYQPQNPIIFK